MLTSPMRSSWLVYSNHYMSFLAKMLLHVHDFFCFFPGWLWYQKCEELIVCGLNDLYCSRFVLEYISILLLLSFGPERSLAN